MKKIALGLMVACMSLGISASASANDLEDQAYDAGNDAAGQFCQGLRPQFLRVGEGFTERLKKACHEGFDDFINSNRTCQKRMGDLPNGFRQMREARASACD